MTNPVLVEVTRGSIVESRHRGAIAVVDGDGKTVFSVGDVDAGVFPRSACKAMQALPLVESGAADAYGFGEAELALACSSHNGEQAHVLLAESMLARAGKTVAALECGAHWSSQQPVILEQARHLTQPTALHNNCSGKHAGFVCACCHQDIEPEGYVGYDHPLQGAIRGIMESLTGASLGHSNCGVDGCSIPSYAVPLKDLAHGFARMGTGVGLQPLRATASRRLIAACMAEPFYVAGTGRACTRLMQIAPGEIFCKTGAEGVFVAVLPTRGIAIALKCDDGAGRAAEAMIAAMLAQFFDRTSDTHRALVAEAVKPMRNWNGIHVGDVRVAEALLA